MPFAPSKKFDFGGMEMARGFRLGCSGRAMGVSNFHVSRLGDSANVSDRDQSTVIFFSSPDEGDSDGAASEETDLEEVAEDLPSPAGSKGFSSAGSNGFCSSSSFRYF